MHIDVHAHLWPESYLDLVESLGNRDAAFVRQFRGSDTSHDLKERFAQMDAAGVDMQVLSPGHPPLFADKNAAREAATLLNDEYARITSDHASRFCALAHLPFPHITASLEELDRAIDDLQMVGVSMTTTILGRSLVDPEFEPIFHELDRRGSVLCLHPAGAGACSPLVSPYGLRFSVGAPIEDTIAVAQLIVRGVPIRYPRLKIIVPHLGGATPMLLTRLDRQIPWEVPSVAELPSRTVRRMWYDTVGHNNAAALRCAVDTLGADRLVLGTDFPVLWGETFEREVAYIREVGLADADVEAILGRTAQELLQFPDPV